MRYVGERELFAGQQGCAHERERGIFRARDADLAQERHPSLDDELIHSPLPRGRSEEHTSELQSLTNLVCRLLLEKKNTILCVSVGVGEGVVGAVQPCFNTPPIIGRVSAGHWIVNITVDG